MDIETIDQEYSQLQTEFGDVAHSVQQLAGKLQTAAEGGDANAKEWLLDLKQVALDIKDEQIQVNSLLQAIHGFVASVQAAPPPAPPPQQYAQQPMGYGQQGAGMMGGGMMGGGMMGGGRMGGFLNSGFGRAMEMGAGIGLGQDLINSIF